MVKKLIEFIDEHKTAFGATSGIKKTLEENGYELLDKKKIEKGKKYYITRNDSSIIAFNVGKKLNDPSLHITASHTDCPSFKLKPNPIIVSDGVIKLNVEGYGGGLRRPWFDRPLSLAGRVIINSKSKVKSVEFKDEEVLSGRLYEGEIIATIDIRKDDEMLDFIKRYAGRTKLPKITTVYRPKKMAYEDDEVKDD